MNEDITFSNMDSWRGNSSGKFGLSFKQIILLHVNRCIQNGSLEFRGGYMKRVLSGNHINEEYIPDSRDVYTNSVKMLRALLLCYYDNKMQKEDEKLQTELKTELERLKSLDEKGKEVISDWNKFRVDWHIRLFEELIMLSKRLNFFEEETAEDEI